jgi:hypothetical protein
MSQYLEISIDLTELGNGSFEIKARSPAGQASAPFKPPFTLADIGPMLVVGGLRRGGVSSDGDETRAAIGSRGDIGVSLYQSLFQGAIAGILARTEGLAANRSDGGIRIRMNFNLLEGGTAAVAALPWELMRKPGETDPLLVSTQTVLVRSLDVNKVVTPRPMTGPLRVLLIRANPKGTAALDLSREGELIGRSLSELPGVMVDEVDPVEDKIFSQLANAAYHVVHYMGHGDFAATKGGMLLLEDDAGNAMPTSAKAFAHLLRDEPLRLVFLNACDTGTTPQTDGLHPFAGVAAALVANGVPAVVAMQFPITDRAALTFSKVFYERIAAGDAVDLAVAQGRSALYLAAIRAGGDDDAGEWATPVLYMRAEDGAVLGGRAVATPLAASGSSAQTTRTHGLWNQHSALTWVLLGIVVAFIAFVALVVFSPDAEAPPAAEKAATAAAPAAASTSPTSGVIAGGKGMETSPASEDVKAAAEAIAKIPDETWINDLSDDWLNNPWYGPIKDGSYLAMQERFHVLGNSTVEEAFLTRAPRFDILAESRGDVKAVDMGPVLKLLADTDSGDANRDANIRPKAAYLYARWIGGENPTLEKTYFTQAADGRIPAAMAQLVWIYHDRVEVEGWGPDEETLSYLAMAREKCNRWRFPGVPGESKHPIPARCLPPRP